MKPHASAITLGVDDLEQAKQFYAEGLGWPVEQDYGRWVSFSLGDGSLILGLYTRDDLAADAGVSADGSGFRAFAFSYLVRSEDRVEELLDEAARAGGKIIKPAERSPWGGTSGYFADPDGNLWKVAAGPVAQNVAE